MRAAYLPYFFLFLTVILRERTLFFELLGIFVGHVFYYLYFVVPVLPFSRGINVLSAPKLVKKLTGILQLDSNRELLLEAGDFVADDNNIPNVQ
mmetsp:Transcript_18599/g.21367  ORF Transcript_18599/g.21367 Transcript_18599/m.21367 type:complete len:94 (+) Transcript_18599:433-714(+)